MQNNSILEKFAETHRVYDYSVVASLPNNVMVELTNACNLSCPMCHHKDMRRKVGFMAESLFRQVVNEAATLNVRSIGLYTVGEPFLHPSVFDCIRIAKKAGIHYVYVTTNGQASRVQKVDCILDSGLDSIKFSINAGTKETYETTQHGGKWDVLIENIKRLKRLRDAQRSALAIYGSFVLTDKNADDFKAYTRIFGSLVDGTLVTRILNQGGQVPVNRSSIPNDIKRGPCNMLWNRIVVTYEGFLTLCCMDFDAMLVYSSLVSSSLKESWNSAKMQRCRELHKLGKFAELPMCGNCDYYLSDQPVNLS